MQNNRILALLICVVKYCSLVSKIMEGSCKYACKVVNSILIIGGIYHILKSDFD